MSTAEISEVYATAEALLDAFKDELDAAELTIILGESEEKTFDLETADVVDIALYLLGDLSPSDFLAGEQTIAASYTATATVEGVTFSLAGTLKFQAVADPAVAAKAAFLAALADKAAEMDVAEVVIDEENISVTFLSTAEISEVYATAEALLDAFKDELDAAELTIILGESEEKTFDLETADVVDIALYLLGDLSPSDFLAGEQTIAASYTATATVEGVTFSLAGTLKFQAVADPAVAAKAAFLAALADKAAEMDVAEVVIDEENISVTFLSTAEISEVYATAEALLDAFKDELDAAELTIILGESEEKTFDLETADVVDIALYLLGDLSPSDFLAGEQTIAASYTATATVEGVTFSLAGTLKFQAVADPAVAAKAAFLAALADKAAEMDVAEVVIDEENISVTFLSTAEISEVYATAEALLDAFKDELDAAELTIILGESEEKTFDLETADVVDIALYLLGDLSPSDFLAGEQTIAASYTATATVEGVTFSLAGTLKFKMTEIFTIYNSMELEHDYNNVTIAGSEIEVDLGGYTAQVLTVTGNDVTLKNGTIIDLTIAEGVENVTLEDIKDNEAGTWIFAGGGSGSIVLRGSTAPKGTVVITSPTPIEIRSESGESEISGNVIIETVARVIIDTPVQGDIEVRAASESITVKRPVKKITAFFKTCIRIDHRLSQSERPKLEKPAAVVASAVLIDDDEDEIENVEFEDNEDLSQPEAIIVSIEKIIVEVKPGDPYSLPAQVEVIYSDGTLGYKAVAWSPTTVDTSEKGTFTFVGTVEDYAGIAQLILRVKADETFYDLTYTAGENGSIQGDTNQSVKHGESGSQVEAKAAINYHFVKWSDGSTDNPRIDTNITADVDVQALFAIDKYTVIFLDWDGETLAKERIPHGGSATAPTVPEKEGYTFTGWDKEFDKVTSDLTVTALYSYNELTTLGEMIADADERARPGYTFVADTHTEQDWDQYWGDFEGALNAAKQTQGNLIEKHPLTEEDEGVVATAIQDLQRAVEILDGIE
ncbi:MAG: Ig-like domain-containing protein, partial [bacterium]